MQDKFEEVSKEVDSTLATLFEVIEQCEKHGLEDKTLVAAALLLFDFWKDNSRNLGK